MEAAPVAKPTVSKRKGVWTAVDTDSGQHFVKHGAYPPGHWPETKTTALPSATPSPSRSAFEKGASGDRELARGGRTKR